MNIRRDDLVLEIGSGHNPKSRSDVLCDKYLDDNTQRGGGLVVDRPVVAADAEALPFRDGAFDYIICSHVLEHADDAARFIGEVQRVGKAGYLESPSEIGERLYGWAYHHWLVNLVKGRLVLREKRQRSQFGTLFHRIAAEDRGFARFHERRHDLFLVRYEWRGEIEYAIVLPDEAPYDLSDDAVVDMLLCRGETPRGRLGPVELAWGTIPPKWRARVKAVQARTMRRARPRPDLRDLLVCPSCHGDLEWDPMSSRCRKEGLQFPVERGIPRMLLPDGYQAVIPDGTGL